MSFMRVVREIFGLERPEEPAYTRDPMQELVRTAHTQNEEIWRDINERRSSRGEEPLEPYRVTVERLYGIDRER